MTDWFDEKATQVSPETITAFGIEISSRYGNADEMIDLIAFAKCVAQSGISQHVIKAFYDSKACLCSLELSSEAIVDNQLSQKIFDAAEQSISQFTWLDGVIYHGGALARYEAKFAKS